MTESRECPSCGGIGWIWAEFDIDYEWIPCDACGGSGYMDYSILESAPAGKTCKLCKHLLRFRQGTYWFKCDLSKMTNGAGTDWRAGWPCPPERKGDPDNARSAYGKYL